MWYNLQCLDWAVRKGAGVVGGAERNCLKACFRDNEEAEERSSGGAILARLDETIKNSIK